MSHENVYVTYRIECTYGKEIPVAVLASHGAPVDDLDELSRWLHRNAERVELDVLRPRDWIDIDSQSVDIEEVEFTSDIPTLSPREAQTNE